VFLDMYARAIDGMHSKLLKRLESKLLVLSDWHPGRQRSVLKMDHLACFAPGMLALGAYFAYVMCCCRCGGARVLSLPFRGCVACGAGYRPPRQQRHAATAQGVGAHEDSQGPHVHVLADVPAQSHGPGP
jgi:hypothetical protein